MNSSWTSAASKGLHTDEPLGEVSCCWSVISYVWALVSERGKPCGDCPRHTAKPLAHGAGHSATYHIVLLAVRFPRLSLALAVVRGADNAHDTCLLEEPLGKVLDHGAVSSLLAACQLDAPSSSCRDSDSPIKLLAPPLVRQHERAPHKPDARVGARLERSDQRHPASGELDQVSGPRLDSVALLVANISGLGRAEHVHEQRVVASNESRAVGVDDGAIGLTEYGVLDDVRGRGEDDAAAVVAADVAERVQELVAGGRGLDVVLPQEVALDLAHVRGEDVECVEVGALRVEEGLRGDMLAEF